MKAIISNVFAFIVFAACAAYVTFAVITFPATRSGVVAVTSGQAFAVALAYLFILLNNTAEPRARIVAKLKRLTRRQVKLIFAELTMWLLALSALAYSIFTQL